MTASSSTLLQQKDSNLVLSKRYSDAPISRDPKVEHWDQYNRSGVPGFNLNGSNSLPISQSSGQPHGTYCKKALNFHREIGMSPMHGGQTIAQSMLQGQQNTILAGQSPLNLYSSTNQGQDLSPNKIQNPYQSYTKVEEESGESLINL